MFHWQSITDLDHKMYINLTFKYDLQMTKSHTTSELFDRFVYGYDGLFVSLTNSFRYIANLFV